jgi:UDP-N-acetyl-2-amino-2-deoxyglucuronate dehydrogenase
MTLKRTAIIGLGMAVKPHAQSYLDLADRVEVAHAFSPTKARRDAFAEQYGFPVCDNLETILSDPSVDFVTILTPPNTHLELTQRCAAAGKHVLLEKPLEISTDRARALVSTCRDAGVKLGLVLQHRFRPSGARLAEVMASGKLGAMVGAAVRVLNWRPQSYYDQPGRGDKDRDGGGVLLTQGIHTLDLFLFLAGMPQYVMAYADTTPVHQMETEDMAGAVLKYESGAIVTLTATTAAYPGFPETITLYCENGSADINGTELHIQYSDGSEEHVGGNDGLAGGAGADPMDFPNDYHRALIEDFMDALDEGRDPAISGESALNTHNLIDAILSSSRSGCAVQVSPMALSI